MGFSYMFLWEREGDAVYINKLKTYQPLSSWHLVMSTAPSLTCIRDKKNSLVEEKKHITNGGLNGRERRKGEKMPLQCHCNPLHWHTISRAMG